MAYIATDKIVTAIAVVLLMSPDFIVPFEFKVPRPTGWVLYAEPVPTDKRSHKDRRAKSRYIRFDYEADLKVR